MDQMVLTMDLGLMGRPIHPSDWLCSFDAFRSEFLGSAIGMRLIWNE